MRDSKKISAWQAFFLLTLLLNGAYSLLLPQGVGQRLNNAGGAVAILAATVLALLLLWGVKNIAYHFKTQSLTEYLPQIFPPVVGKLLGVVFCLFFVLLTVLFMASFHEMLCAELLPNTPRWVTISATFILICWVVCNGLEDIARFSMLVAPSIFILLVLVLLGNAQDMYIVNILPVKDFSLAHVWEAARVAMLTFLPVCTLLVIYPRVREQDKVWRLAALSIIISGIYQVVMFLGVIAIFGMVEGARINWPLVELARMVHIGPFLERLEATFIAIWLSIAFLNGSILTYCAVTSWQALWSQKEKRRYGLAFGVIWFSCVMVNDMLRLFLLRMYFYQWVLPIVCLLLAVIWLAVLLWRHRLGKEGQRASS